MDKLRVVVVGAGAAGFAAAARLMERGVRNVVILEAEDRMGGRIHTAPFENDVLELGAQWVHGEEDNVVTSMAHKYGLLTASGTGILDTPFIDSTGKIVDEEISEKMIGILSLIHDSADTMLKDFKGSLGDYYTAVFKEKMEEEFSTSHSALGRYFLDWFHKLENCINGADSWFETSGAGLTEYWECEGNMLLSWKSGGYRQVLDLLMNKYPNQKVAVPVDANVKYKKEVKCIKWKNLSEGKVIVECSDGTWYTADHAIVTVSLGVLKDKAQSLFCPALPPQKLNAIKGLGFGCVNKIFLKFPYRWWPEEHSGFGLLWTDEDMQSFKPSGDTGEGVEGKHWLQDVFGFYYVDNQPLVLCGWIVGPSAPYMEQLSDEQVVQGCLELLQKFAGRGFNVTVPRPEVMLRSCWSSNPHFRGAYSYRSMASENLRAFASHLADPVTNDSKKPVLLFAGEATHEHYYSTVHGAVESGWREADRVFAYYGCHIPNVPVLDRTNCCHIPNVSVLDRTNCCHIPNVPVLDHTNCCHIPNVPVLDRTNCCQVIIVGAGIAGLAAAKTLVENGVKDIRILEAQDHPGGRISSVLHNGRWIETGAQWIHGQNNEVWKLADRYDLLSAVTSSEGEGLYIREDGVVLDAALVDTVKKVVTEILQDCEQFAYGYWVEDTIPQSVGQHLRQKFERYLDSCAEDSEETRCMKEELFDWHLRFQVIDNSCTVLDKLSAKAWGNYSYSGGTDYINFKSGYSSLVRNMVEELPAGTLCLNSPVVTVKWQQSISCQVESCTDLDTACKKRSAGIVTGGTVRGDAEHQANHNGVDTVHMTGTVRGDAEHQANHNGVDTVHMTGTVRGDAEHQANHNGVDTVHVTVTGHGDTEHQANRNGVDTVNVTVTGRGDTGHHAHHNGVDTVHVKGAVCEDAEHKASRNGVDTVHVIGIVRRDAEHKANHNDVDAVHMTATVRGGAEHKANHNGVDTVHMTATVNGDTEHHACHNGVDSEVVGSVEKPPVLVSCSTGATYAAGHVIVTCSLGCLKACCNTMFEPALPHSMIQAIEDMGYAAINKIFLDFKEPWWTPDIKGFQLIWSKDSNAVLPHNDRSAWLRDVTGFDVIPELEGVLLGWVGGKGAQLVEEMMEDEIGQHCTELLRKLTQNKDIPLPCHVIRSQWYKNPYIRGGYSNSTVLCDASSRGPSDLATPVWAEVCCGSAPSERKGQTVQGDVTLCCCKISDTNCTMTERTWQCPVVLLAGEATHERYFSTTHGAYESGQAQARVILDYLSGQTSSSIQKTM